MMNVASVDELKNLWTKVLAGQKIKNSRVFLSNPSFAYLYAKYIRKKKWSEQDEFIFYQDLKCAYLYCVFTDDKISDHLHNFFIAKKLGQNTDEENRWIDQYFDWIEKKNKCRKKY
jgi:hypothetical protein